MEEARTSHPEEHGGSHAVKLNWLRAAVLGANDGIVSIAALVVGVAAAGQSAGALLVTGIAGLIAGAMSMAVGEYVSVSSQRDTESALLAKERHELKHYPERELDELVGLYERKGVSQETARKVAEELTAHDVFAAHAEAELKINPEELTNPWHAAFASAISFVAGGIVPLVVIVLPPDDLKIAVTFGGVLVALVITGVLSAWASGAGAVRVTTRIVVGGILAMLITFGIGRLFGVTGY